MPKVKILYFSLAVIVLTAVALFFFHNTLIEKISPWFPVDEEKTTGYYVDMVRMIMVDSVLIALSVWLIFYFALNDTLWKFLHPIERTLLANHKRTLTYVIIGFVIVCVVSGTVVLEQFPNSADEYVYLFQAEDLSRGQLWSAVHDLPEFFEFHHLLQKDGKWIGRFPPGYPILLSVAYLLHIPPFLINVILGAALLLFFYKFVNKFYGERTAVWSVITLASSAFFIFNAATFFSHVTSGFFTLCFVYLFYSYLENAKSGIAILAGFFIGMLVITRYYTAVLVFAPFFVYAMYRLKFNSISMFFWIGVGGILPVVGLLGYNYATTGNALVPVTQWGFDDEALGFVKGHTPAKGVKHSLKRLVMFIYWCSPQLLLLYFAFLVQRFRKVNELFHRPEDYLFLLLIFGYFFYYHSGGNQYGPRFYLEAFPFLIVFVMVKVFTSNSKWLVAVALSGILFQIGKIPFISQHEHEVVVERTDVYRLVDEKGISNAVVFIADPVSVIRPMPVENLNRNDKEYRNSVLYARDLGEENVKLRQYYPSRKFFRYTRDPDSFRGKLEAL